MSTRGEVNTERRAAQHANRNRRSTFDLWRERLTVHSMHSSAMIPNLPSGRSST